MTRDDLFNTNASIVRDLAAAVARVAPTAHILVISNPVNSTVPIVAETLKKAGVFDPKRVFGVTTLDVVRAARFLAGVTGSSPSETVVTVVGGHSGPTIVPLLSQTAKGAGLSGEVYDKLINRIQYGGDEVVKAKDGAGSATLSMAYAGAKFTNALLRGLNGEKGVVVPTFVRSPLFENKGIDFFSSNVELGVCFSYRSILTCCVDAILSRLTVLSVSMTLVLFLLKRRSFSTLAFLNSRRTLRRARLSSLLTLANKRLAMDKCEKGERGGMGRLHELSRARVLLQRRCVSVIMLATWGKRKNRAWVVVQWRSRLLQRAGLDSLIGVVGWWAGWIRSRRLHFPLLSLKQPRM
jgi:hypothetical protein